MMLGKKSGVIKRLQVEVPQLQATGSCNSNNLANTMQHAVTAFNPDMKQALVNLYFDLGGAKGKDLKKMNEFQNVAVSMEIYREAFLQFVITL